MYRFIILQLIAGISGGIIAAKKGRNYLLWFLLCFLFPLLVVIISFIPQKVTAGTTKKCPYCSQVINKNNMVCRYCKKELPINLVKCKECGSFVPERDYCAQCNQRLQY